MTIQEASDYYMNEFAVAAHPVVDSEETTAVDCPECVAFGFDNSIVADINNNITSLNDALTLNDYMTNVAVVPV